MHVRYWLFLFFTEALILWAVNASKTECTDQELGQAFVTIALLIAFGLTDIIVFCLVNW